METAPELAGFSAARLGRIDQHLLDNYVEPQKIAGCQVVVARHGHVAHYSALGLMDIERSRPMTDDAIFRIYSMTKPITSIALMQLYEQGMFQLNDPVYRVVPAWREPRVYVAGEGDAMETRPADRPITFRDLLSHTAGLSYGATGHPVDNCYRALGVRRDRGETLSTFVNKLAQAPLHYSPGEHWMYSYATDVCGHLVEALSGMSLDHYFQTHIFEPLGMTDTAFHVDASRVERFTANYQRNRDKTLKLIDDPMASSYAAAPTFLSGGGGMVGTTADYLKFCEMLRCGGTLDGSRIIGPRTLKMMRRNHLAGGNDLTRMAVGAFSESAYEGIGFGLGFATTLSEVAAGTLGEGDYFWGGAASTIFWVDPNEDLVVIFMTQLMPSATFNFRGQLKNIIYAAIDE
jgi:CubicO group peptidase (beta-lactamase class C family)